MKTYLASNIRGVYLGAQAVVVANDKGHARRLLVKACEDAGIPLNLITAGEVQFYELDTTTPRAVITNNGDY